MRNVIGCALAMFALLAAAACADDIPSELPQSASTPPTEPAPECGWMRWIDGPLDLEAWFEANPGVAALHRWDGPSGTFQSAGRASTDDAPFDALLRTMVVWRESQSDGPPNLIDVEDARGVIQLTRGINLVRWWGRDGSSFTIRDAFRWISPHIGSIIRFDIETNTCHQDVGQFSTHLSDLNASLARGDLLALHMHEDATWTQSWIWSPRYSSFGEIDPEGLRELREQVREFSGFIAARFGLAAESYALMLMSDVEAMSNHYETLTGTEWGMSWWPDGACGVAWSDAIGLLEGCRGPIAFDHEFVHVIQAQLAQGGIGSSWETEPAWLIEGAAEYISARYRAEMSYKPYRDARQNAVDVVEDRQKAIALEQLVNREDFREIDPDYAYSLSFLAAEWLAAHAGEDALFTHMRQLSRAATNWDLAFEIAFGMTVDDFYEAFEKHSTEFDEPRPHRISGRVLDDSGAPVPKLKLHAYPWTSGWSSSAETDTDGSFTIEVRAGAYRLSVHSQTSCTAYGYLGQDGFGESWFTAQRIDAGSSDSEQLLIQLPGAVSELRGRSTCKEAEGRQPIRGRVLRPDGAGASDVQVLACGEHGCGRSVTDETGAYSIDVAEEPLWISVGPGSVTCELWGMRGADGELITPGREGSVVNVQRLTTAVDILLPAPPEELEVLDLCWMPPPTPSERR